MALPTNLATEALVVHKPGDRFEMKNIILDQVRSDEVLVEMKYSGICQTDNLLQAGLLPGVEFPAIFGHEGAGIIRALGSDVKDKSLQLGDHVLLSFNVCGKCKQCIAENPSCCHIHSPVNVGSVRLSDGSTPARLEDGTPVRSQCFGQSSFSRMSVVAERSVVKCPYPESLPYYAPLGCGFQTGAGTVLNTLKPDKTQSVVIFGVGSVGLAAVMAAAYLQVKQLVAVDVVDEKLAIAAEFGATDVVNSKTCGEGGVGAKIRELTDGGADFAIDCTGSIAVIESLFGCLAPRGTATSVGVPPPSSVVRIEPQAFLLENKSYIGVVEGGSHPQKFIPKLMELHQQGHFPVDKLCKVYSVRDFETALDDLRHAKVVKPIIYWD
ncbi:zinc-binding dehydrogenase [Hirsutella rhossiliensis]|uniref:Zinc-binding dehydrogenase domain-containing protein n=1 Tax=Hirsutella rhossiliensis TaxID=111463 RepID=A0A9P8SEW4_9HYPO|nr:zinc-binding dehydrogenase domain-containing protein [Hirsutella rhossiliensis]KAH0960243.1 zinc-binding dehydrogenase domain-containing protein [Hirsutella rhossiliensis]